MNKRGFFFAIHRFHPQLTHQLLRVEIAHFRKGFDGGNFSGKNIHQMPAQTVEKKSPLICLLDLNFFHHQQGIPYVVLQKAHDFIFGKA